MRSLFNNYRRTLGDYQSILSYAVLGVVGGLASGLIVIAFEFAINWVAMLWSVGDGAEGFEALPRWLVFALPVAGATLLGLGYSLIKPEDRETGIVHVISHMHSHYSVLPLKNALVQFVGGTLAMATGQSGGREGPGVHLGGAINSLLGQKLQLPNNSLRVLIACGTAGGMAFYVPEILGMGYDTLRLVVLGQLAPIALITIAVCKILATSFSCGVGMPIGLIGPNLLIGACLGGILDVLGHTYMPELVSDPTLYIVMGMAASMGAVLNAPLAAILAVVELTNTVGIAMPALLAVVAATLTNTGVFRQKSAHQAVLRQLKRVVPDDPLNQLLHRTAVTSSLEVSVVKVSVGLDHERAELLTKATPGWCLVERNGQILYLVRGDDLVEWLKGRTVAGELDLTEEDIRRWTVAALPARATLGQALDTMRSETVEALWVHSRRASGVEVLQGIVTREAVEQRQ